MDINLAFLTALVTAAIVGASWWHGYKVGRRHGFLECVESGTLAEITRKTKF